MKHWQLSLTTLLLGCSLGSAMATEKQVDDWRGKASQQESVENLIKVMPGASNLMLQMGERYRNLYWAGKKGQWDFAAYQAEEMQDLIETLQITRPKRAATAQGFLDTAYPMIIEAAESKHWPRFEAGFLKLRDACMTCHVKNEHAFIVLPKAPRSFSSPVLE